MQDTKILEYILKRENKMKDNTLKSENNLEENAVLTTEENNTNCEESAKLTSKEIFDKIAELQKQLTNNGFNSLHTLLTKIDLLLEKDSDTEQIAESFSVFKTREISFLKMLEIYQKMYEDIQNEEKIRLVIKAFEKNNELIKNSDLPPKDKLSAFMHVSDHIAETVINILVRDNT